MNWERDSELNWLHDLKLSSRYLQCDPGCRMALQLVVVKTYGHTGGTVVNCIQDLVDGYSKRVGFGSEQLRGYKSLSMLIFFVFSL